MPLLTEGAGITFPGSTGWSQRAPGAGQFRTWFGSPYHGLVPSGTYGLFLPAFPWGRRALAGNVDAGIITRTAHHVGGGVLWDLAVRPFRQRCRAGVRG